MRTNPMPLRAAAALPRPAAASLPEPSAGEAPSQSAPRPAVVRVPPEREEARALIARLRAHLIQQGEPGAQGMARRPLGRGSRRDMAPWGLGLAPVDRHLPVDGLAVSGLHDISPAAYGDFPAACGFALALAMA